MGSVVLGVWTLLSPGAEAATRYVVKDNPLPIYPYTSWANAARHIADAVGAAVDDDTVLVSNGTYTLHSEIVIDKDIMVQSVNGRDVTIVDAQGSNRCANLSSSKATLEGFTLTRGMASNDHGGGVYCELGASVIDCRVVRCVTTNSGDGGGVYLKDGSRLIDSTVEGNVSAGDGGGVFINDFGHVDHGVICSNSAYHGGGVYIYGQGDVRRSEVQDNWTTAHGGGLYLRGAGELRNCIVDNNTGGLLGGGVYVRDNGALVNCTVAENLAEMAGGVFLANSATVRNSIVYFNYPEDLYAALLADPDVTYSCLKPLMAGEGNFSLDPQLGAAFRLAVGSPCEDAGTNMSWMILGEDIDGTDRIVNGTVDMGAHEFVTSSLACNFIADAPEGMLPHQVVFTAHVAWTNNPGVLTYDWDLNGDAVYEYSAGGLTVVTNTYATYGYHTVGLRVSQGPFPFAKRTRYNYIKVGPSIAYVNPDGLNAYPYETWANGAHTIEAAVGAGVDGTLVLVTNDTYSIANRILVDRGVTIRGHHGPLVTIVDGGYATRCFYLTHSNAVLEDLSIRGGLPPDPDVEPYGGGVYSIEGGTLRDSIVESNAATFGGGALFMRGGLVTNTAFRANHAATAGALYMQDGGQVNWSLALENEANTGGGFVIGSNTTLLRSWAYSNIAHTAGGGFVVAAGTASNVQAQWNVAGYGGGAWGLNGLLVDCILQYNNSTNEPDLGGGMVIGGGSGGGGVIIGPGGDPGIGPGGGGALLSGCIMIDSLVYSNRAFSYGGGLFALQDCLVSNCTLQANNSSYYGAGALAGPDCVFDTCRLIDNYGIFGGGAAFYLGAALRNSLVSNNSAAVAGGIYLETSSTVQRCTIANNRTIHTNGYAGGFYAVTNSAVLDCLVLDNFSYGPAGGGACGKGSLVRNSSFAGNVAAGWGGGVAFFGNGGRVESCTLANNTADTGGGVGAFPLPFEAHGTGSVYNSIVYHNTPDPILEHAGIAVSNSCISILQPGVGNFDTPPELANPGLNDLRLLPGSPCINIGVNHDWMIDTEDAFGDKRIRDDIVDVGAHEHNPTPLSCAPVADALEVTNHTELVFRATVDGGDISGLYFIWDFDNDGAIEYEGYGLDTITNDMSGYGTWIIALTVTNASGEVATTVRDDYVRVGPGDIYVAPGGLPVYPYNTWANAATNLHQAYRAAIAGTTVWVSNGMYAVTQQVLLDRAIEVVGVNGAGVTHVSASEPTRLFYLSDSNALVSGLHLSVGKPFHSLVFDLSPLSFSRGGGIYINRGGTIEECEIEKCVALNEGGAIYAYEGGEITASEIFNNDAAEGAGVYLQNGGVVSESTLRGNGAVLAGGAAVLTDGSRLETSYLYFNTASNGAGVYLANGGDILRCGIRTNIATGVGGGIFAQGPGRVLNTTCEWNTAVLAGGIYAFESGIAVSNCLIQHNEADNSGGGFFWGPAYLGDLVVHSNVGWFACGGLTVGESSTLEDSEITWNVSSNAGGLNVLEGYVENCAVQFNQAYEFAGGAAIDGIGTSTGTARDCVFSNNIAGLDGGGVVVANGGKLVSSLVFENLAFRHGGGVLIDGGLVSASTLELNQSADSGGGAYIMDDGDLRFSTIISNKAGRGGGVYLGTNGLILNCNFFHNAAAGDGGGVYLCRGGIAESCLLVSNAAANGAGAYALEAGEFNGCDALYNFAGDDGGGFALHQGGKLQWCEAEDNIAGNKGGGVYLYDGAYVRNALVTGNSSTNHGGGMYLETDNILLACTVADNKTKASGGGVYSTGVGAITNSIIYDNIASGSGDNYYFFNSTVVVYSCAAPLINAPGNTADDPMFVSGVDYHLTVGSPCVDAGIGGFPPVDLDAVPRPLDGDADGTAEIDMGAYELASASGDTDHDHLSDAAEVYTHGTSPTDPDSDNDEQLDGDEVIAATDPLDATNFFGITWLAWADGDPRFAWQGAVGRRYDVYYSTNVYDGWYVASGGKSLAGVAGEMVYTNSKAAKYHVRVYFDTP